MVTIYKGNKLVVYKSTMCLKLNSIAIEDCKVKVDDFFAKAVGNGDVIVYGEYKLFFVFSFVDGHNNKIYLLKTQKRNFSEYISCKPNGVNEDEVPGENDAEPKTAFNPEVSYVSAGDGIWSVTVKGQFEVSFKADTKKQEASENDGDIPQNNDDSTTIISLGDTDIDPSSLFDMDRDTLEKMFSEDNDSKCN